VLNNTSFGVHHALGMTNLDTALTLFSQPEVFGSFVSTGIEAGAS